MKFKFCAVLLMLAMALSLTACRFEFELGGIEGGVHLELTQKTTEGWHTAGPSQLIQGPLGQVCRGRPLDAPETFGLHAARGASGTPPPTILQARNRCFFAAFIVQWMSKTTKREHEWKNRPPSRSAGPESTI